MPQESFWHKAFHLYYDGFRQMTLGRTLWLIIGVKLFIMFAILKVFFFPDFLKANAGKGHEAGFVADELVKRAEQTSPATDSPPVPTQEGRWHVLDSVPSPLPSKVTTSPP